MRGVYAHRGTCSADPPTLATDAGEEADVIRLGAEDGVTSDRGESVEALDRRGDEDTALLDPAQQADDGPLALGAADDCPYWGEHHAARLAAETMDAFTTRARAVRTRRASFGAVRGRRL